MMKQKKLYVNRYNFYAFNCSLIIMTAIFLVNFSLLILSLLITPTPGSIGIIGGADGLAAIYILTPRIID